MKRDLNTKELAMYFHTTVEEVRRARAESKAEGGIAARTKDAPDSKEDSNAWYCRNRTDGTQHCFELNGQRYCALQETCISQIPNGTKAKKCGYTRR